METAFELIRKYTNPEAVDPVQPNEIVLAAPKHEKLLKPLLEKAEIPYYHYTGRGKNRSSSQITLSSMANLKGHEYKIVILTGIAEETFPIRPTGWSDWSENQLAEHDQKQAALLYVAISRGIWRVHMLGVGGKSKFLE